MQVHRVFLTGGNVSLVPAGRPGPAGGRRRRAVIHALAGRARQQAGVPCGRDRGVRVGAGIVVLQTGQMEGLCG